MNVPRVVTRHIRLLKHSLLENVDQFGTCRLVQISLGAAWNGWWSRSLRQGVSPRKKGLRGSLRGEGCTFLAEPLFVAYTVRPLQIFPRENADPAASGGGRWCPGRFCQSHMPPFLPSLHARVRVRLDASQPRRRFHSSFTKGD